MIERAPAGIRVIPRFHARLRGDAAFAARVVALRKANADNAPSGCMDLGELLGMGSVPIGAKQGDLILWNSLLPHGTLRNDSDQPRRAMFVSMSPVERLVSTARAHLKRTSSRPLTYSSAI
jgi:ectoine hydroxylase-related dioxygenase (phytanoyl-CoA dioxygenase family)